jgi:hypothetical protein
VTRDYHELTLLAFSPDGRLVAGADWEHAYLWERASGALIDRAKWGTAFVPTQIVITRANRVLVVGGSGVWDMGVRKRLQGTIAGDPVVLCPEGRTLAAVQADDSILIQDVPATVGRKRPMPNDADLVRLWRDLASKDAARAWRAQKRLGGAPREAVSLIRGQLKPAAAKVPSELADLDSDEYSVRESATKKLAEGLRRGDRVVTIALQELRKGKPSLEAYLRAKRLLASAGPLEYTQEELREIRAVAVLEQIGGPDAISLLRKLTGGGPAVLTAEARAALARLTAR